MNITGNKRNTITTYHPLFAMFFWFICILRGCYTSVICRFLGFISSVDAGLSEELGQTHTQGRGKACVDYRASSKDFPWTWVRWSGPLEFYGRGL